MRFLFVQNELSYRGAERVVASLTKSLVDKHHTVRIIFLKKDLTLAENFIDPKVIITIPIPLLNKIFQNNIIYTLFSPLYAVWIVRKYATQADVLISDSFPCLWPTILIAQLKTKKVYWMLHSLEKIFPVDASLIQKAYFLSILFGNKRLAKYVRGAFANSPKVRLYVQELFPQLEVREIIPPVSQSPMNNQNSFAPIVHTNRKKIMCIGHIHPLKNQQLAIDAFIKVRLQLPDISLFIIGDGDFGSLNTYNLSSPDINFTGKVRHEDLPQYYKIADIVLQTSFYPEGLGLTPFEGLYYKKLPIVVKGSGAAIVIEKEKIGIVVENNSDQLANALFESISHPQKYEYTVQRGWEYVTTRLTPQRYVSDFLDSIQGYEQNNF